MTGSIQADLIRAQPGKMKAVHYVLDSIIVISAHSYQQLK